VRCFLPMNAQQKTLECFAAILVGLVVAVWRTPLQQVALCASEAVTPTVCSCQFRELGKRFPTFYKTRRFFSLFKTARHFFLHIARKTQSTLQQAIYFSCFNTIPAFTPRLSQWFFPSGFPTKTLCAFHFSPVNGNIPSPHPNTPHSSISSFLIWSPE